MDTSHFDNNFRRLELILGQKPADTLEPEEIAEGLFEWSFRFQREGMRIFSYSPFIKFWLAIEDNDQLVKLFLSRIASFPDGLYAASSGYTWEKEQQILDGFDQDRHDDPKSNYGILANAVISAYVKNRLLDSRLWSKED